MPGASDYEWRDCRITMENQNADKKSLKMIVGKTADFDELARDCVAFANAQGGRLLIGIENESELPPKEQRIQPELLEKVRKRIGELTVNVTPAPELQTSDNGGQYIELNIPRSPGVASTTDGRYYIRISDTRKPVTGDEVMRLANERATLSWETLTNAGVPHKKIDSDRWKAFRAAIAASDRVSAFVKSKMDNELLDYYLFAREEVLTNLGILWVGYRDDRASLATAPVVQFIKFDDTGAKVMKRLWDDYSMNPIELIDSVWREIPDWNEGYEMPDGLFRRRVPHYDEVVVRELLANALVHRPYTQRGDIFIHLYPDRLEVINPGKFPLGVTPKNILHVSMTRNPNLAKVFYDLKLIEREGSGYDRMYEVQLTQGKQPPEPVEGVDSVTVTLKKRMVRPELVAFIARADEYYQLSQKEKICLGLLAQHEVMTALHLERALELGHAAALKPWLDRLLFIGLVKTKGRTKGTAYYVPVEMVQKLEFETPTTLKRIEPHRLRELVITDLQRYRESGISEIHQRVGSEIPRRQLQMVLTKLTAEKLIGKRGQRRHTRYFWKETL